MAPGLKRALAWAGGERELAELAGVYRNAVRYWIEVGVPARRCVQLEELTGIPRAEFNTELYGPVRARVRQRSERHA